MKQTLLCVGLVLPLCVVAGLAGSAWADGDQGTVSLTIYNSDLALVQDIRHLTIAAGRSRLEFKDVSSQIRPETVALSGDGISVVEQNFDFDLLTPAKMMEKQVGKQVQIVRLPGIDGKEITETATVLSVNDGVVLKIGDHVEVLRDDSIPTRVIFDGIPENLRARPTLSVTVGAQGAGPRDVTLSYLSTGLSWTADYVAQFDEKQGMLALQGWVTLTNKSGTGFSDANVRLVAGNVNLSGGPVDEEGIRNVANRGGGAGADAAAAGDFPIYGLPEKVSVANNQTKQVGFLNLAEVKAAKAYGIEARTFRSTASPSHADVMLNFSNTGKAMPQGTVRVYVRDTDGTPKFVGEQTIDQTPAGSDLSLTLGQTFDVTAQSTMVSSEKLAANRMRYHMRYEFRNAGAAAVTVRLRQDGLDGDGAVSDESQAGKRINSDTESWDVAVPARGSAVLTFTATNG